MPVNRLTVGAHVVAYINSKQFGIADIDWSISYGKRESHGIDWLGPIEFIPGSKTVRGSMTLYKVRGDGGVEAAGMAGTWADTTLEKYFSLLVLDRVSDTTIFRADRCSIDSQSWKVGRGYIMGQIQFSALEWGNEAQASNSGTGPNNNK